MQLLSRTASLVALVATAGLALSPLAATASSHREAPFVTEHPKVDATDFYMFRSYEHGREDYVTLVANYLPLQDPYGGPNYFFLDQDAVYRILIDNTGDGVQNIGFEFRFDNELVDLQLPVGGEMVSIPLIQQGSIASGQTENLNIVENYRVQIVRANGGQLQRDDLTNANAEAHIFTKPVDNIGNKTIADYDAYADDFIYDVKIPGCADGRLFVGQRKDSFAVNLGETFDLVNTDPLGPVDGEASDTEDKNITTLALEVPISCLTDGQTDVIGAWTAAYLQPERTLLRNPTFELPETSEGAWVQVSRLGNPLVNEVVIGLKDKDQFNASRPVDDLQFATYVTNPTLPELLEILFGVTAPDVFPREDLLDIFIEGVPGLNEFGFGEMQRLNVTIPPVAAAHQNNLGVIAGDNAGYPNGRRPGDDTVDISLRAVMGVLLPIADAPSGQLPYTDGALQNASQFDEVFPYLTTPLPGSPN